MAKTDSGQQTRREQLMLQEPLPGVITRMAVPSILSFLITSIYNLADTYFVSGLGESATAAVSVNASLDQIIMMAGSMLAVGAASYISRLLGAREKEKADQVLSTSFFLAFAFGAAVMVLGTAFMGPMVRLLGATDTCEQYSIQYATYVLLVAPFMATTFVMNQCLRAEGSPMRSMLGMGFGGILNCFLDPIFIFRLGLGVSGASMATAISKLVSFAILIFPYLTRRSVLRLSIRCFHPSRDIIVQVVTVGSSSMFRSGLAVVSAIVLNNIAGGISDAVLAGIGVSNKIMMFPFGIILGFGTGFQPVAGFNWGARRYDRVQESYRFAAWTAIIGAAVMGAALALCAQPLIGLFAKADHAAEMRQIGALCIRLQCLALPVHGWVAVVNMLCAGLGNARGALLLSTSRQGTCFLPIVYPMAWIWGAGGVAAVQAVADILTLILAVPLIRRVMARVQQAAGRQEV
ncbi:MATE family efflux transporter [Colidextribacter sp. OB.20]|uniref:MATE family efflux transporter n=1 Tax=Colidextribacter sp. OB.20 TaxID=2304568 RepID=UPI00136A77A4|nr:MATE family efflux transporter [Colidextribacter sp. OB.20]NBI10082.1 MATE family efflux transporter [Colidextribacter sp. OB.20]